MRLYQVQATECNGRPEYAHSKLLAAEDIDHAWQLSRDYFRQWYDDGDEPEAHITDNPNEFRFVGGSISLEIDRITETTLERWKQQQAERHSINILPETKSTHEKLEALPQVCQCMRDCPGAGAGNPGSVPVKSPL